MSKVAVTNDCWIWNGCRNNKGYGGFYLNGKRTLAHWFLLDEKPDPKNGKIACHSCDNPACVNPDHIFIGSYSDNMKDMIQKGRHRPEVRRKRCEEMRNRRRSFAGSSNPFSIFTEEQALIIKSCPGVRGYRRKLAKAFGVSETSIKEVRSKRAWKHLPQPTEESKMKAIELIEKHETGRP